MLNQNTRKPSRPPSPWVGVDTTSDFFRTGKIQFYKAFEKDISLQEPANCFQDPDASQGVFSMTGDRFVVAVYSPSGKDTSLQNLRNKVYLQGECCI